MSKRKSKRVEKVAIVGAGIAGLSLAHALRSSEKDLQISVFDSRESLDFTAGSGGQFICCMAHHFECCRNLSNFNAHHMF